MATKEYGDKPKRTTKHRKRHLSMEEIAKEMGVHPSQERKKPSAKKSKADVIY